MGIHYNHKSKAGDRKMEKELKRKMYKVILKLCYLPVDAHHKGLFFYPIYDVAICLLQIESNTDVKG